jgi:hypothetical protein
MSIHVMIYYLLIIGIGFVELVPFSRNDLMYELESIYDSVYESVRYAIVARFCTILVISP